MAEHGTAGRYQREGCRCQACRNVHAAAMRRYRHATGNADNRAEQAATREAARRYRAEHPTEWFKLLDEERWKARKNRDGQDGAT